MRTLIDIPDDLLGELDTLARQHRQSRAAEVRDALKAHVRRRLSQDWIDRGAGYWKGRDDIGDAVEYQRRIREDRSFD